MQLPTTCPGCFQQGKVVTLLGPQLAELRQHAELTVKRLHGPDLDCHAGSVVISQEHIAEPALAQVASNHMYSTMCFMV